MSTDAPSVAPLTGGGIASEYRRQVDNLQRLGLLSADAPTDLLDQLLQHPALAGSTEPVTADPALVPFVLVPHPRIHQPSSMAPFLILGKQHGFVSADTADIDEFAPIATLQQPTADVYAVINVDRGDATRNLTPDEAMAQFAPEGRSPLTISEGIAYLLHYPHALRKNHCFQTAGSRREDRRVPGIWISNRAPKIGFCWAGNRHTWLGIASAMDRVPA
ncbi:DUF5701 family protein [Lolliginicoccus suaedae]|uniref:DUF5701 family protein n=1 Tax=Lolliginicoccus suaedae TaxID=2605429 RepID=UPI0011ED3C8D|nr:DUF5701 family protein [Lolliginicoccus suaedae]